MRKYVVLASLLLVLGFVQLSPAATWTIEKVTDNTEPDIFPFVAAVSSGLMVIYTHGDGDNEAFIANNFSGSWTSSRITDNTLSDVALDIAARYNEQTAHIALWWEDVPDNEISYCVGTPESWNISRITDDADADQWPSIALDKNGYAHMAYHKVLGDFEIFYANNVSGSWVSEQVTDNGTPDAYPWMALDSDGNPHVVYTDGSHLIYKHKTAGIWTDPVTITGGLTFPSSLPFLVIDRNDYCHVSYTKDDGADYEIYYANNVTGSWQESKVTTNDFDDAFPTLYVDSHNKIHIAYTAMEPADAEVFYANNVSGIWSLGRVTDNSYVDNSIVGRNFTCDAQRIGHIFFWNNSDGDDEIYHAYSNEPLFEGIEESVPAVAPICIKLNSTLSSSVSYSVPSNGKISLKIYDVSGSLVKTLVDGTQTQGEYTVTWNGGTNSGVHAAPGVYFYRLVTAGQSASVKGILK